MRSLATAVALLLCCAGSAAEGSEQHPFEPRLLSDALRELQQSGLPLVFSSEIVTPGMRVITEPRATTPRQQLDELLAPHGLRAERGPGGVIQVVRSRSAPSSGSAKKPAAPLIRTDAVTRATTGSTPDAGAYSERVTVTGSRTEGMDHGASEVTFDADMLQAGTSILQDDALQAVHAMPRVAAADDFRSEFSVRGSP